MKPRIISGVRRSHIDLAPTIADLMGIEATPPFRGESLLPEIKEERAPAPRRVVADLPRMTSLDRRRAVIDGDWKIVAFGDDATYFLFDIGSDPYEERDLARTKSDELERMKGVYAEESAKIKTVEVLPGVELKGAPLGRRW
jgi:arylsulfatase A-like enzyme